MTTGKLQLMTTGRGLTAGRLRAECWPFLGAPYAQGDEKSDASLGDALLIRTPKCPSIVIATPYASSRAPNSPREADSRPAISPRPVVISCSLPVVISCSLTISQTL